MSTPSRGQGPNRRDLLAHLTDELDEALADIDIESAEVGEPEYHRHYVIVPVIVEGADLDDDAPPSAEDDDWMGEDPEGFDEAMEYLLDKNSDPYDDLA